MANEAYTSNVDTLATETVAMDVLLLLADRDYSALAHPAITYLGDAAGSGSTTHNVLLAGLDGYDEMAAVAENASVTNTAITDAVAACTVARQAISYERSDMLRAVDQTGIYEQGRLAESIALSAQARLLSMIAAEADGFSSTVGSSGVDMTVQDFLDAKFTLDLAQVPGRRIWLGHSRQVADFERDLVTQGGALQFSPETIGMLQAGAGFKGVFLGTDVYSSAKPPTANASADRASGMWAPGAIGWRSLTIPPNPALIAKGAIFAGFVVVEPDRDAKAARQSDIGNLYAGTVEIEDSRGVTIITDA